MKNYYAIIPASVRYDDRLTPNAKLLYGEITALTNDKGYCWASNTYFSELYKVSNTSISKWISQLNKYNYIKIQFLLDDNRVQKRKIRLATPLTKVKAPIKEILNPPLTKVNDPLEEKLKDNSNYIVNNNTINKSRKSINDFPSLVLKSFNAFELLFPERNRPKTKNQKIKWLEVIDLADRVDKINPRQLYLICKKAREDEFWSQNFFSIAGIRKKTNGVSKLDRFISKFGKDIDQLK